MLFNFLRLIPLSSSFRWTLHMQKSQIKSLKIMLRVYPNWISRVRLFIFSRQCNLCGPLGWAEHVLSARRLIVQIPLSASFRRTLNVRKHITRYPSHCAYSCVIYYIQTFVIVFRRTSLTCSLPICSYRFVNFTLVAFCSATVLSCTNSVL